MNFKMSDKRLPTSLETGSYKPDDLETGSHKPENLETGSNKPEKLETSSHQLEKETDSSKSEPRLCPIRKLLLQNAYPKDFRSRMVYAPPVPLINKMRQLPFDLTQMSTSFVANPQNQRSLGKGSLQKSVDFMRFFLSYDDIELSYVFNKDAIIKAPEIRTTTPFVTPDGTEMACCFHDCVADDYFVPSQQHCVSSPQVIPNLCLGDTLVSLAARNMLDWPSSWKLVPTLMTAGGAFKVRIIPGDFHYIVLKDFSGDRLILQASDYELYCLAYHNPALFGAFACRLDGNSYVFHEDRQQNIAIILDILRLTEDPKVVWSVMLYGYKALKETAAKYGSNYDFWFNLEHLLKQNPKILTWRWKNLLRILKYCNQETFEVHFPETALPNRFPSCFEFLEASIMKSLRCRNITLQGEEINLQGLTDVFGLFKSQPQQTPSLLASLKNLGKFTGNVNGFIDFFKKPPFDFFTSLLVESSTIVAGIFRDFAVFITNPAGFVREFVNEMNTSMVADPEISTYETVFSIISLALSYAIYETNPTLSVTVFFVTAYSTACHFVADKNAARKIAILASLIFMSVMKALQSLSAPISLQSSSSLTGLLVTACGGIACLIAGVKTYGTSGGIFEYLTKNTKELMLLSRGTLSLVCVLEFVIETVRKGVEYLVGETAVYKTLVKCSVTNKDLQDYIVYSLSNTPENLATTLTMDEKARKEWERMCNLHNHFLTVFAAGKVPTENHVGYNMYSKAYRGFTELKEEYIKVKDSLDYYRPEPFMVWLWGEPGTGKTWCRDSLVSNMYRWHQKADATVPDAKTSGLLYVRNPADKYMSSYVGQFAVAYDDVGQNRQSDNPEFLEIMAVGSTNQVRLNMADLAEKGRLFSSKVVIMASNTQDVNTNNLIMKEDAFNRRRHIVVEVLRPKRMDATISTSECDFSQVALHLTDPRNGGDVARFPAMGYGPSKETWMDFYKWLAPRYVQHVTSQKVLLEKKMQQLEAITKGEKSEMIYDYDLKEEEIDSGDLKLEDITFDEPSDVVVQSDEGQTEVKVKITSEPPMSYVRQLRFLQNIKNCADRFRMASLVFPELYEASETYKRNPSELSKVNLKTVYKRCLRQDLMDEVLIVRPPTTSYDPEELAKAWEFYTAAREGFDLPWLKYLTWAGIGIGLFGAIKLFMSMTTGEDPTLQAYSHDPKAPPTPKIVINKYEQAPLAPGKNNIVVQSTTQDLLQIYKKALFRVECIIDDEVQPRFRAINFVQIAYDLFLAPKHFFQGMKIRKFRLTNEFANYPQVEINDDDLTPLDDLDFYIVRIKAVNYGKNLLNHFPTRNEIKSIIAFDSLVLSWNAREKSPALNYTGDRKSVV